MIGSNDLLRLQAGASVTRKGQIMARFGMSHDNIGTLRVELDPDEGTAEAVFVPTLEPDLESAGRPLVARFEPSHGRLVIFPINTLSDHGVYLGPKYARLRSIAVPVDGDQSIDEVDFEDLFEQLPRGFVKDFEFGLGLQKGLNRLVHLIEEHTTCTSLVLLVSDDNKQSGAHGTEFRLTLSDLDEIWSEIQRINGRGSRAASRVKDAYVHNRVAGQLGLRPVEASLGRHPVSKLVTQAALGMEPLTGVEQDALLSAVAETSAAIAESHPEKLVKLRRDIELVNLDRLIAHLESSLEARHPEAYWQKFFSENDFALQQVFGVPMVSVRTQATVGGTKVDGSGGKVSDFLHKHSITNNLAIVEIKTPSTKLLSAKEYRGGVFGPSSELAGAVTQVLDQAQQLTMSLSQLKQNSRLWDLEAYAVKCFVIAGRTPGAEEPARQKSLEMYRSNSRSVVIVTYDEVLELLRSLRRFLAPAPSGAGDDADASLSEE